MMLPRQDAVAAITALEDAMDEDVQRYGESASDERRSLFYLLHALIMGIYPEAKISMSYGVPTYRAKAGWVALGYWKRGVSVYTNGPQHIAEFKTAHPEIKTGKGCINFRATDVIPVTALQGVITHAVEHPKEV